MLYLEGKQIKRKENSMNKRFLITTVNLEKNEIVHTDIYEGKTLVGSDYEKHLKLRVGKTFSYQLTRNNADFNGITTITRIA